MITRIITNHIKPGKKPEYISVSRDFCAALVARCGCLEAKVFSDLDSGDVLNIERWPDRETAEKVTATEVFAEFVPRLAPLFDGNDEVYLEEV